METVNIIRVGKRKDGVTYILVAHFDDLGFEHQSWLGSNKDVTDFTIGANIEVPKSLLK